MVIITQNYKASRKFNGKRFTLEEMGTKSKVDERKNQLEGHGCKVRVLKGKKKGYVSQQYLLYAHCKGD